MFDKIMPLSEAIEGYDLFDKMKVQKGTNLKLACSLETCRLLTFGSHLRGAEVDLSGVLRLDHLQIHPMRLQRKRRVESNVQLRMPSPLV